MIDTEKCPCCGGKLRENGNAQKWYRCDGCVQEFTSEWIERITAAMEFATATSNRERLRSNVGPIDDWTLGQSNGRLFDAKKRVLGVF